MSSNSPRNSYRSVECPEVPSQQPCSSWYSEELEPEGPSSHSRGSHHESSHPSSSSRRSHRQSDKPGSSTRSSHRESGHSSSSARGSHHENEVPSSRPHTSSSTRRANTTAAPSSKNPFARLVATGDLPHSNNPFSRHESHHAESSGSLRRSNAVHSRSRSSHQTSSRRKSSTSHHNFSASTIRGPSSTVRGSSPSSMDEHLDPYTGALVPQRSRTVAHHLSSSSRYYNGKQPARSGSTSSSRATESTSSKTSSKGQNVTYNITNINIGSNNVGKGTDDPLAGMSTIEIGETPGYTRRSRSTRSHTSSGRCTPYTGTGRVWECDDDESLEDLEKERMKRQREQTHASSAVADAEAALRESEERYLAQFGHPCPDAMFT